MHDRLVSDVLIELNSSEKGLTSLEAEKRQSLKGKNEIKDGKRVSAISIFLGQFNNAVVWILIIATIISSFVGEYVDAFVIIAIIVAIAVIGFYQEYNAERSIEKLKELASLKATVIRDNKKSEISSKDLVVGDITLLETGNKVPADARIIESINLKTLESALTGESHAIEKHQKELPKNTILADRKNMIYSGTLVVGGRAKAVVTSIGMSTEMGKIAKLIEDVETEKTPLQKDMDRLGKFLGVITIIIALIVFAVGMLKNEATLLQMLLVSVSLAVAAIPEGLPAVVVISLALGTKRMLKRNALIRRLPSVETLGSTTVICTDKTGTLTANEMTVKKIFAGNEIIDVSGTGYSTEGNFHIKNRKIDPSKIKNLLLAGILNNNSELKDGKIIGDPTEGSLIVSGAKAGFVKESLDIQYKRIDEIEFTSERKLMTTVHKNKKEAISYVKGAPEVLIKLCSQIEINGKTRKITKQDIKKILDANHEFADSALRVLGFAYKKKPGKTPEKNLVFAGLQGMIDPPRQDVKESIEKCEKAGIRVIMITGDHEITAKAVAKSIGLHGNAVTGTYIDEHPNLEHIVEHVSIFARVNPEHKIKIVDALKKKGHIVAMTGDGVNDAPALKKADIGIAMGISGTDVSKEASSMILIDDKFSSIVNAVEEGRGTYDNIRKYFAYLISGNIGEVLIIFFGIIFGLPLPLTATQILLINLVTDGLPALALSADPFEPNAMSRKPRKQGQPIYKGLSAFIIYYPILLTITSLSVFCYFYFYKESILMAQTATFLTISISELYQAFACRSTIYPAHKVGLFKNKYLILAVVSSFLLMVLAVYIEPVGKILGMTSIGIFEFIAIVVISSFGTLVIEMSKHFRSRSKIS